jgi:hypothetical protein
MYQGAESHMASETFQEILCEEIFEGQQCGVYATHFYEWNSRFKNRQIRARCS